MAATKKLSDLPDFNPGWQLSVDGKPVSGNWVVTSPYGEVAPVVVCDDAGYPLFDRPAYREADSVHIIAWGRTQEGDIRIGMIRQPRPHADDPEAGAHSTHGPVVMGQVPMGFVEKILGETGEDAARREAMEETGAAAILSVVQPACPWNFPNPTFVPTWSGIYFVEVDLEKIEEMKKDRTEPIYSAEYISPAQLIERLASGKDESGALYRMGTSNSALLIFFATYPELWPAAGVRPA